MATSNKKYLLVEGQDDLYAVAQLMGHYIIPWEKNNLPVTIKAVGSVDKILVDAYISTELQSSDILGIMIDANDSFQPRWDAIRRECSGAFPEIPARLPLEGLVLENADGKRVGAWIMPDNTSKGMLETFLSYLVPDDPAGIWVRAKDIVSDVMKVGAPCKPRHKDKADIHTWLAWQDPPGEAFGNAIVQKILDAKSRSATGFVTWFRRLYLV